MPWLLKILLLNLVKSAAPAVCLFYRKGWFLTPDDPVSPYGCGTTPGASNEPTMHRIYARFGTFIGDWWWLGVRNRAYGLTYALKPDHFKSMTSYDSIVWTQKRRGPLRTIEVDGYREYTLFCGLFHVIAGYRLRPVVSARLQRQPYRPVNMDARPILSFRPGNTDE